MFYKFFSAVGESYYGYTTDQKVLSAAIEHLNGRQDLIDDQQGNIPNANRWAAKEVSGKDAEELDLDNRNDLICTDDTKPEDLLYQDITSDTP